jgi:hypothetical protein
LQNKLFLLLGEIWVTFGNNDCNKEISPKKV